MLTFFGTLQALHTWLQTDRCLFHYMSQSCRHSSKHLRHWTHHNCNQIWVAFSSTLFNCCFVAQKRGIEHNMTTNRRMPISLHVIVMPAFFWTLLALNVPQLQTLETDTHFITHCCHADILPNTLGTDTYTTNCKQTPISQCVAVMPTFFQTDAYFTARLCHASILPNSPGIEHAITANRQMPFSLYVTVMPTFFQTPEALNTPQLQPDK